VGTLSDRDLVWAMRQRLLVIEPDIVSPIQPASIDLRLGNQIRILPHRREHRQFDPDRDTEAPTTLQDITAWELYPDEFIQACTLESIGINPKYEGFVAGKSSWARVGLQIESAGYVDPGWGYPKPRPLTLEIKNLGPLVLILRPGMKICQLRIAEMNSTPGRSYGHPDLGSHYADSEGPVSGRFGSRSVGDVHVVGDDEVVPEPSPA
jgi:dCTP deaminase